MIASARPLPMPAAVPRADGGSAYSGVGGQADGGDIHEYNSHVPLALAQAARLELTE